MLSFFMTKTGTTPALKGSRAANEAGTIRFSCVAGLLFEGQTDSLPVRKKEEKNSLTLRLHRSFTRFSSSVAGVRGDEQTLQQACSQEYPGSARCVQSFDDSLDSAIRITYRISLRSSSMWEPRHPSLKVVLNFRLSAAQAVPFFQKERARQPR